MTIKKEYDHLIRDVLVEEQPVMVRIGCKVSGYCYGQPTFPRRVTLTSQLIIIQVGFYIMTNPTVADLYFAPRLCFSKPVLTPGNTAKVNFSFSL